VRAAEEIPVSFQFAHAAGGSQPAVKIPALGLDLIVTLSPEISGGALSVIETVNAPGFGPPMHRHHETEVFRVLEGRYLFESNGRRFEAAAGDTVSVPGGDAHAFVNITEKPARQLIMILPAMDAALFFTELGKFFQGKPDRDALNVFGRPWGVEFLGPPLSPTAR
jgi:quercetin dioxygenase-like cupin family protein